MIVLRWVKPDKVQVAAMAATDQLPSGERLLAMFSIQIPTECMGNTSRDSDMVKAPFSPMSTAVSRKERRSPVIESASRFHQILDNVLL